MDKGQRYFTAAGAIRRLNGTLLPRLHKAAVKPHHAYWFDQLPLARSMKCGSSPAEGIEHVPPAIGYYNSASPTLVRDINPLGKKPAVHSIFVDPPLADRKSLHLNSPRQSSFKLRRRQGVVTSCCLRINHNEPLKGQQHAKFDINAKLKVARGC